MSWTASAKMLTEDIYMTKNKAILSHTLIQDQVFVVLKGISKVEFFSINGNLLKTVIVTDNEPINTQDLGKGVYMVKVSNENKMNVVKVIKK